MYQRILVAIDGSKPSDHALREAVDLAKCHHGILRRAAVPVLLVR